MKGILIQSFSDKLDVLDYWRDHRNRYPNLSKMASDVLSIPIIIVVSDFTFSLSSVYFTER